MDTEQNPLVKITDRGGGGGGGGSSTDDASNSSWSSKTTWVIASGSLEKSITFDSSDDSPVESSSPRISTSLVLKPPSPVSGPCEIKLYFSQKYNIRQIYVRSTARIYEIYYSQSQHSENEYLCTARCCIAERDDQVLRAVLKVHEQSPKYTVLEQSEDKFNGETSGTYEDDWVDVKVFDTSLHESEGRTLSNETNCNIEGFVQDYYEATVEISDSEPCTSVTIRLLSLQSKDCVCIDEIYAFAELVDLSHSENPSPYVTGSAESSLMAMLFPTLLQLSKSGTNAIQAELASDKLGKVNKFGILSKAIDSTDIATGIVQDGKSNVDQQYMKLEDPDKLDVVPEIPQDEKSSADQQYVKLQDPDTLGKVNKVEIFSKVTDLTDVLPEIPQDEKSDSDQQSVKLQDLEKFTTESANSPLQSQNLTGGRSLDPFVNSYSPCGRIEEVLEQLVSRVSKIEEVCLRFEENMLKPMNNMEMRIQRVEEQLESLAKNSFNSGLPPGTRFVAPSFSCDSNSSSFHNDGSVSQPFSRKPESGRKGFTSVALSNLYEGMPDSVDAPHLLPSLVVAAPEFCCAEDEQDDVLEPLKGNNQDADVSSSLTDSHGGKPKLRLIDDVLAAALSNFLLSPSDHPSKCKQSSAGDYDVNEIIGNEVSSQNVDTIPIEAHEVTTSVNAYEEHPKYTQILTVTAPEFTSEETGGEEDLDFLQSLCAEASTRKTDYNEASPSLFGHDAFPVTSELSHYGENKSTDQLLILNDLAPITLSPAKKEAYPLETDVQNQFFEGKITGSLLGRSTSFTADQAKDSTTDYCVTIEEARQSDSSIFLSPIKKDVAGEISGYNTDTIKITDVAQGPNRDVFRDILESQTASLDDFESPLVDVKFTSHEISSYQSSLEALLGDQPLPEVKFEANHLGKSGGDFDSEESNFIDMDDKEMIDPLMSRRLLVDLGIYDIVVNSDDESGLDGCYSTSNHEMVASLI